MYTIIYFSPTGNTKYIAEYMKINLDEVYTKILKLEFLDEAEIEEDEQLTLMYPIHGFNAPRTVKRFVKKLPEKLFDQVHLIAVGCNNLWVNDAVSLDLRRQFKKKNYDIGVDEILAMPLTFIMSFPEDAIFKSIAESKKKVAEIITQIKEKIPTVKKIKLMPKIINFVGKAESPAARMFGLELHAKKGCISCGICWENCPEGNIKPNKNGIPKFAFKCEMCMRCIYSCPVKVITPRISKFIPIKAGYNIDNYKKESNS
ncbi:EFR1 family ferrodoxin [Mycoplasmatota bacterium WC30]